MLNYVILSEIQVQDSYKLFPLVLVNNDIMLPSSNSFIIEELRLFYMLLKKTYINKQIREQFYKL